jgi:hypothetical protein
MKERQRIITVIVVVILFNFVDQLFLRKQRGFTDTSVYISLAISIGVYITLVIFFGKKHMN